MAIGTASASSSAGGVRSRLWRLWLRRWPWIVVGLAPIIGVAFLLAPVINQIGYPDPWFDDAYAWSLAHDLRLFSDPYYGVRFPPILLLAASSDIFGVVGGYLVLHYLILLGAGAALYACVRQFASPTVAAASAVLLALDVYYLRLELWDYASFVQIPAMLVAVALWPRGSGRWRLLPAAGAGAAICLAAFSNPIALLVVPPVLIVEVAAAARRRDGEMARLLVRLVAAVVGGGAVFLAGWLVYWLVVGYSPADMLRPTLTYIRAGNGAAFARPISSWIFAEPKIYAPVIAVAGMALVMGRRLLRTDIPARLGQFSILFVAELWLYRLVNHASAIVESWWAYDIVAVSMAFAGALILSELDSLSRRRTRSVAIAVLGAAVADLAIRAVGMHADTFYNHLRGHYWRELLLVVLGLAGLLLWRWLRPAGRTAATFALFAAVSVFALAPAVYLGFGHTGEFSTAPSDELSTYSIGRTMARDVAARDSPASRTLIWFPSITDLLGSAWATLPTLGGSMSNYAPIAALDKLTAFERQRLDYPTTARILVVGQVPGALARARTTLRRAGYQFTADRSGSWLGGRVEHQMLRLRRNLPPGGSHDAVRLMTAAIRRSWREGSLTGLCDWTWPTLLGPVETRGAGSCENGLRKVLRNTLPPAGPIKSIDDVANSDISVTFAGDPKPWIFSRTQGEWLLVSGVPWLT